MNRRNFLRTAAGVLVPVALIEEPTRTYFDMGGLRITNTYGHVVDGEFQALESPECPIIYEHRLVIVTDVKPWSKGIMIEMQDLGCVDVEIIRPGVYNVQTRSAGGRITDRRIIKIGEPER